ncbi:hypothetical protein [Actinokineospora sp. NBRC 105648]|uniref:hypothetical protein n=1 Tax=Actinokineospora sp. NBRC 105648 TaxID=3032206 RepID=UPI0024A38857|nr:hypothetical protein [Actinokineospora sp. NBRC 105648]GLZ36760.1 hypothetical protein Acsp05_03850 [Actinokineospora sp. NBRC 105648]
MTSVPALTRRLADTPPDFLADDVSVAAVVSDTLVALGGPPLAHWPERDANLSRLILVTCWLAHGQDPAPDRAEALHALCTELGTLADLVDAARFTTDPDRREELARLLLRAWRTTPAGETPAQAEDRLSTVDSVRRHRVLAESRAAEQRAEAVRQAMADRRAEEAAARYSQV